jgi:putative ABC transport system permease protein
MLLRELLYAARTLRKAPAFAVAAVATIALGIGASIAIFSVTNTVLLRPLPYKQSDRLVLACNDMRRRNVKDFPFSNADFLDLRSIARKTFEDFAAVNTGRGRALHADGTPEQIRFAGVSINFFRLMGARIAVGRDFQESDGLLQRPLPQARSVPGTPALPQGPEFAILSWGYFQRRFGGAKTVMGQALSFPGGPGPIVVGVLSPDFELFFPPEAEVEQLPDMWFAANIPYDQANRNLVRWHVVGRMKPGVAIKRAQAEVETVTEHLRRVNPVMRTADQYLRIEPMKQHLVSEVQPAILALMGAVIFLLLIACANVANLMLVRTSLREREFAIRTALGGTRRRLVAQIMSEALVISALATMIGLGLAWFAIHGLLALAPENVPRLCATHIDPIVLTFSTLAGLGAAAMFGLAPASGLAQPDTIRFLRAGGSMSDRSGGILRNGVGVLEVALCLVLLIGSGLMFRTFLTMQKVNVGFEPHNLLTFQLLGNFGDTAPARHIFKRELQERLASIPGVQTVTASQAMPLAGGFTPIRWGTAEALTDQTKFQAADLQVVLPGYFEAMHTPLIAGRTFTEVDNTPDRNMLIVDQALASKAFPFECAVGKRILFRARAGEAQWGEIVGVVAHQRYVSFATPGREQIYVTDGYIDHVAAGWWALRTAGDPSRYTGPVRDAIRKLAPELLVIDTHSMDELVTRAQSGTRFSLVLIGVFAIVATLLAAVGLYSILSTLVRQRTAEIGVRMAVGAAPSQVLWLVMSYGLRLSTSGVLLGVFAALALTRVMTSMLVGVKPTDPSTFATISILFILIATLASWVPARRAARLDPTAALREE